ncbi:MAG: laccase domain-containing protein [Prevotella sp.]|nr:laccase domain-containing protein [Prevotella sp.]
MNDFSIIDRDGVKLISVDCINRLGNYHAYYSTGFGGVSDMPGACSMNLAMFKECKNDSFENVKTNFRIFAEACGFPISQVSLHRETHKPNITVVTSSDIPDDVFDRSKYGEADGQITTDKSVALLVYAADCCTIMMVDPVHEVSGTTHCGWRNSANGTIDSFVSSFVQAGGALSSSILVLGPSICSKHYSVDEETAEIFAAQGYSKQLGEMNEHKRYPIDLNSINSIQLQKNGISSSQIHIAPWCTWEGGTLRLPSYRRDEGLNGMLAGVLFHRMKCR